MKGVAYAFAALVALFGALTQASAGCYGECNGYQDNRGYQPAGYAGGPAYADGPVYSSGPGYYDNGPRGHTVYYERGPEYFVGGYERPTYRPAWRCSQCGEVHGGQFTACWKCGREADAA